MPGRMREVLVGRQQSQFVTDAELGDQGIHGAQLNTRSPALVSEIGRPDVIIPIRLYECKGTETFDDRGDRLGAREPLKQFLQNNSGCHHHVSACKSLYKDPNFRRVG